MIYRNGLRLGKLVNTLLDFSRIEAGRMQASFEPLDLGAFTTELASVFQSAIERAGMRYEVDCPSLRAPVYVDREMWEKVVFNLLSNALKFTFDGTVSVWLGEQDGQAALRVADTGVGIAAAEIPRLFDRFHRIENAPSRSNEGSGIGLALVRELVGLHGGTISAESTENVGTTFTVRLPFGHGHLPEGNVVPASGSHAVPTVANPFLAEAMRWLPSGQIAEEAAPAAPVAGIARRDADGKAAPARVLLADDNADMREYLQRLLRPGYEVTTVTDGQAALEAARANPPDILISDVMMPRLGGLQLVAALRADLRTADVPVLLLSARAGQEAAIEGLEAGADDYLVKPFSAAELLARVRANVELARVRSHHARWRAALLDSLLRSLLPAATRPAPSSRSTPPSPTFSDSARGPAVPAGVAVVARRERRPRSAPLGRGSLRAADDRRQGELHRPVHPPRRAPDMGGGKLQRGQRPRQRPAHGRGNLP